jgi:glucan phosphoethanolaminetransferase (alkaline phosphatase superfamily)
LTIFLSASLSLLPYLYASPRKSTPPHPPHPISTFAHLFSLFAFFVFFVFFWLQQENKETPMGKKMKVEQQQDFFCFIFDFLCVFSCYNGRRRWNLFLILFNVFQGFCHLFIFLFFLQLKKFVRLL